MRVKKLEVLNQQRSLSRQKIVLRENTQIHKDKPRADVKKWLHPLHSLKEAKRRARIMILQVIIKIAVGKNF